MQKFILLSTLLISSLASGEAAFSAKLLEKQKELSVLSNKIAEQQNVILNSRKNFELFRDKLIERILIAEQQEKNTATVEKYVQELEAILQSHWKSFEKEQTTLFVLELVSQFKSVDVLDEVLLKFHFLRTAYEFELLKQLLFKWDEAARELNKLSNS